MRTTYTNTCLALSLNTCLLTILVMAYQAYILAGNDHPCWHQQARPVRCEQDICAAVNRPAFVGFPSSHILLCRKDGWGVEIYFWLSGVMLRSLSRFMFRTQRILVGVRDLLCRRNIELMLQDLHVLVMLSLTFCLVGGFVGYAKPFPGELLCCGATVLAAKGIQLKEKPVRVTRF